jgi:hypothetical protein
MSCGVGEAHGVIARAILSLVTAVLLCSPVRATAGYGCDSLFGALTQVATLSVESGRVRFTRTKGAVRAQPDSCGEPVPAIALSVKELIALRPSYAEHAAEGLAVEQQTVACARQGPVVYFGLAFYEGEGTVGAGGVGRLDVATHALEIRRPKPLLEHSVRKLRVEGDSLWLATEDSTEGTRGPGVGLVRYDWSQDRLETFQHTPDGPCGLWVNDLLVHDGELWVATDLAISRYAFAAKTWRTFVPVDAESQELREVSCRAVYQDLAARLPTTPNEGYCDLDGDSPRDTYRRMLRERRPEDAAAVDWSRSTPVQ